MKKLVLFISTGIFCLLLSVVYAQTGIHESQLTYYNSLGHATADYYEQLPVHAKPLREKSTCTLNKKVYGWHPYWVGNAYLNYDWDLLSHLSFFSYEVDYTSGNAVSTHGWSTSSAVTAALASGSTKVTLCVTLFANHASFLTNSAAKQTLITNLISLISARGAHGVNVDFEGLPASQTTNFANFMVDLANQMHAAIANSEVSTVLYAVDWSSVFDFQIMEPEVDNYIIMGYDYYYSGSTTAGPTDPLYQFGTSYNYTLSRSITDYLEAACPKDKLILGLPYYGYEWSTSSLSVPATATSTGSSRTFATVKTNSGGNYSVANHVYENNSQSDMYLYNNGSANKECFISEESAFTYRLQHVLNTGIAGIGIWALGYDDGYNELWNTIESKLTNCYTDPCSGTIHDFGGPTKNYYNNEDYTWTIAPPNAVSLTVSFSQFSLEANYDYLYVYDGSTVNAPQITGSPFTGTVSPGTFTSSSGALTFRFTSDVSTVSSGFLATYSCTQDVTPPQTAVFVNGNWQTQDFNANFTDTDNDSVAVRYSLVTDKSPILQSANRNAGYLFDDFSSSLTNQWTSYTGTWNVQNNGLVQSDEANALTSCYTDVNQSASGNVLYHWKGKIGGTETNRRAGLHFFCSDPTQTNGGDSYLVYWRVDSDKCQIYKATGNTMVIQTDDAVVVDPDTEYDFKIQYDPQSGKIQAFLDQVLVSEWTDTAPLQSGTAVSFRSGNCTWSVDDVRIYRERTASQLISVGSSNSLVRFQNENPQTPACHIYSIVRDFAGYFSTIAHDSVNVDWTVPQLAYVNDGTGADLAVFSTPNSISGNWSIPVDTNSGIVGVEVAVGTTPGSDNVVAFSSVANQQLHTFNSLALSWNQTYFISLRITNQAGLDTVYSSDGQLLQQPVNTPTAGFYANETTVCEHEAIQLINTTADGTAFLWTSNGGFFADPQAEHPLFYPDTSGSYSITLTATNSIGSDQFVQSLFLTVLPGPVASFQPDQTSLQLPNAVVLLTNTSQHATTYSWDFGDGTNSSVVSPWHVFSESGTFTVVLVASSDGCQNDTAYLDLQVGYAGISTETMEELRVYPVPFHDLIQIEGEQIETVVLYDASGRLVVDYRADAPVDQLVLSVPENTAQGVYFLKIRQNQKTTICDVIKW